MTRTSFCFTVVALAASVSPVCQAQSLPPVRQLGPVTAVAKEPLGAVTAVRSLPDGLVLVNDIIGRKVLMFDSALATVTVIADTTSATANAYGVRPGGLIPYRGDSTLFVDPASLSMLVIDPSGKIARVVAAPRASDIGFLIGGPFGTPAFDAQGRLVYRAPPRFTFSGPPPSGDRLPQPPPLPDSAALVRFDLTTRKLDTAVFFKTPKINFSVVRAPDGGIRVNSVMNPLPQADDWAVLPDGTIALVRTRDYHVDWISPQGTMTSSPKIPFEWERLTDEAKVAFVDSAKAAIEKARATGQLGASDAPVGTVRTVVEGPAGAAGAPREGRPPEGPPREAGAGGPLLSVNMVAPSELPDYKPPFVPGATRADADGNLWVRTSQNVNGRPVYNVINRKGELVDRVQLPQNRVLIGFGPGGVAYLAVRDGAVAHLEKARIK